MWLRCGPRPASSLRTASHDNIDSIPHASCDVACAVGRHTKARIKQLYSVTPQSKTERRARTPKRTENRSVEFNS